MVRKQLTTSSEDSQPYVEQLNSVQSPGMGIFPKGAPSNRGSERETNTVAMQPGRLVGLRP